MRVSSVRSAPMLALLLISPVLAGAQKLDKDDVVARRVRTILLQDEDKAYKDLKEKSDRLEFQRIFWARRDPDLATPANEYQAQYEQARAEADRQYRLPAQPGSLTDCGRVFILLGKPDEVQQDAGGVTPGLRAPEVWTYRDRPGARSRAARRRSRSTRSAVPRSPSAPDGSRRRDPGRPAEPRVQEGQGRAAGQARRHAAEGHGGARAAEAAAARLRDGVQVAYLKTRTAARRGSGSCAARPAGLTASESGGVKTVQVSVAASVVGDDGKESSWTEQATQAPVEADGSFVAGFKLALRPGKYTLQAGAVDEKSGKGSLATMPIEAPDLARSSPPWTAPRASCPRPAH